MVTEFTHIHHNGTKSIIDLLFVNDPYLVRSCCTIPPLSNSDHHGLQIELRLKSTLKAPKRRTVWRYCHADWERANSLIEETDWDSLLDPEDINTSWKNWSDKYLEIMQASIPTSTLPPRRNRPWLTKKLVQAIRRRNALYKKAKATNDFTKYRRYRNKIVNYLRNAKRAYFGKLNPRKPKEFWKACKLLRKTPSSIPVLSNNNSTAYTNVDKAELLNSFFVSCFNKSHTPLDESDFQSITCTGSIPEELLCDEDFVLKLLASLDTSKATGPDKISALMLKKTAISIAASVTSLFNQSLRDGRVPLEWKLSHVVPIPKQSPANSPDKYRPVSLLSILSKILERHVYNVIADHLDESNPLTDCQWGFRAGRSTVGALLATTSHLFALLEAGKEICAVFYDYRKAFDSVPHRPLLNKLKALDMSYHVLRWVADYLSSRSQCVVVEGDKSGIAQVLSGVPQGSVLGPLLFLIYIDEISSTPLSPGSNRIIYADDVCIYRPISSRSDFQYVQEDIKAIEEWSSENYLSLNPSKCKYMLISRKRMPSVPDGPLLLGNCPLQRVDVFKYLGVLLSQDMSWSPHIQAVCSRAKQVLGLLYRKFYNHSSTETLTQLYISLVRPHLEYACPVWAPHMSKDIVAIENVQKFACKMATHNWNTSYQDLLSVTELPTLERRRLDLKLGLLFKIVHKLCFFPDGIVKLREQSTLLSNTRFLHPLYLHQPRAHTNSFQFSFVPHTSYLWNSLPFNIVNAPSFNSFKHNLHNYNIR